jgi:CARDB
LVISFSKDNAHNVKVGDTVMVSAKVTNLAIEAIVCTLEQALAEESEAYYEVEYSTDKANYRPIDTVRIKTKGLAFGYEDAHKFPLVFKAVGYYKLNAIADATNKVVESNEDNNKSTNNLAKGGKPDNVIVVENKSERENPSILSNE